MENKSSTVSFTHSQPSLPMKQKIYLVTRGNSDKISRIPSFNQQFWLYIASWTYNILIMSLVFASIAELLVQQSAERNHVAMYTTLESFTFTVLLIDYILRWYTSDIQIQRGRLSYLIFPFTLFSLLILLGLVPTISLLNFASAKNHNIYQFFRLLKFSRIIRIAFLGSLLKSLKVFRRTICKNKKPLLILLLMLATAVILFSFIIYDTEYYSNPFSQTSNTHITSFWDALYYCIITVTTIGFGDFLPATALGKFITVILALLGLGTISLPGGILAGSFVTEYRELKAEEKVWRNSQNYKTYLETKAEFRDKVLTFFRFKK